MQDLLKLTDISAVDSNVSGDALIGFDDEADALFVTEQLRSQLFDASEQLADKVTGDATALARWFRRTRRRIPRGAARPSSRRSGSAPSGAR